eukprot:10667481-Lingulodinium_polyedra.AAC.1
MASPCVFLTAMRLNMRVVGQPWHTNGMPMVCPWHTSGIPVAYQWQTQRQTRFFAVNNHTWARASRFSKS